MTIGISAFENCSMLCEVNIPKALEEVGWNAFEGFNLLGKAFMRKIERYMD